MGARSLFQSQLRSLVALAWVVETTVVSSPAAVLVFAAPLGTIADRGEIRLTYTPMFRHMETNICS